MIKCSESANGLLIAPAKNKADAPGPFETSGDDASRQCSLILPVIVPVLEMRVVDFQLRPKLWHGMELKRCVPCHWHAQRIFGSGRNRDRQRRLDVEAKVPASPAFASRDRWSDDRMMIGERVAPRRN